MTPILSDQDVKELIHIRDQQGKKEFSMEKSRILQAVHKIFKFTDNHHSGKFFLIENGKRVATSLFAENLPELCQDELLLHLHVLRHQRQGESAISGPIGPYVSGS